MLRKGPASQHQETPPKTTPKPTQTQRVIQAARKVKAKRVQEWLKNYNAIAAASISPHAPFLLLMIVASVPDYLWRPDQPRLWPAAAFSLFECLLCVCPSISMSLLCDVTFVCMFLVLLRVYITPCICHSVCMALHWYVSSYVWPSVPMFSLYICPSMSLAGACSFLWMSPNMHEYVFHVYVPLCVCLFIFMFLRENVSFVRMSSLCEWTLMCMSLRVYVAPFV